MLRLLPYLLITALLFTACDKTELPGPGASDAVFFFQGTLDGQAVLTEAGFDNMMLATAVTQDVRGVYAATGTFRQEGCSGSCPESWTFAIRDDRISPKGGTSNLFQSLQPGSFGYRNSTKKALREFPVAFTAEPFGAAPYTYFWDFGDGEQSTAANPTHVYPDDPGQTSYLVCLNITYGNGCSSTHCNTVYLPSHGCGVSFTATETTPQHIEYMATASGNSPHRFSWKFDNGVSAESQDVNYQYPTNLGLDTACVTVTDNNGCQATYCRLVVVNPALVNCATNYTYAASTVEIPDPDTLDFSEVTVTWTDASGQVFT
ncbi:MAG: PKD domain-containing protein, partial [Bacteroidota bacterium]